MRARAATLRRTALGWSVPLLLICGWEHLAHRTDGYRFAFVPLATVWNAFLSLMADGTLPHQLGATVLRSVAGLVAGAVCGVLLGSVMGASRWVDRLVGPCFHALRQVPLMGWTPLFALWFGAGDLSELLVIFLASLYPIVIHTYEGVHYVERRYREAGAVLKFSRLQFYRLVLFPAALPSIVTGLTQALGFAWLSAIGSELVFGEGTGLGSLMILAENSGRMEILVVCILSIGVIGFAMNRLITVGGRRILGEGVS